MDKNNKIYILVAAVAIVIVVGAIILHAPTSKNTNNSSANKQNNNTPANSNTAKQNNTVQPAAPLSYNEALITYGTRRIQFSVNSANYCSVIPNHGVYKKGTSIMLDNRSNKTITVSFDGQPYSINAYGFKIITLTTSAKLPYTIRIDCESGVNNGSIILE